MDTILTGNASPIGVSEGHRHKIAHFDITHLRANGFYNPNGFMSHPVTRFVEFFVAPVGPQIAATDRGMGDAQNCIRWRNNSRISNILDTHIPTIRALYGERCAAMLSAMRKYFPSTITWNQPEGGMFIWVRLPEGMDSMPLLDRAIAANVAFVPGAPFFATPGFAAWLEPA